MEEGKNPEDSLVVIEMEHLADSLSVGVDVEVREHHAFGFPCAAAAENDGGQVVHRQRGVLSAGQFDQPRRGAEGEETCENFPPCADGAGDILQPDNRRPVRQLQLGLFDKDSAGHDRAKACKSHGGFEAGLTDRVVQIHAGFPAQESSHVDQCAGNGRWEKDPHVTLVVPMPSKRSAEYDGPDQGLERRHMRAGVVCHGETKGMPPHGMDEFTMQGAAIGFAQTPGRFSKCANCVAKFVCRCARWQRCAEGHGDRIGNAIRPFCEETTAFEAKDAAPQAIQVHGKNRHLPSLHNPLESATERQQRAGTGDLSFREDADDLSVVECLPCAAERPENDAGTASRCDRDHLHGGHEPFEQRVCRIGGIHHEPNGPIDAGHEQEAIDERHMVRDEQCSAGLRNMLLADDAEAIERIRADDEQEPQEQIWHQPKGPQGAAYSHAGGDEENIARRETGIGE